MTSFEPIPIREIEPARRASVAVAEIGAADHAWRRKNPNRRPSTLSHREALEVLEFEALLVATEASRLANGIKLDDDAHDRLQLARRRIQTVVDEALRR